MSASNDWTKYYLTTEGWVEGTHSYDGVVEKFPSPSDWVLACRLRSTVSSAFSKEDRVIVWRRCKDRVEADRLLEIFGPCPGSDEAFRWMKS